MEGIINISFMVREGREGAMQGVWCFLVV